MGPLKVRKLINVFFLYWLFLANLAPVQAQSVMEIESELQPEVATPTTLQYSSVFEKYHNYDEVEAGSWQEANKDVTRGGGHYHDQEADRSSDDGEKAGHQMTMPPNSPTDSLPEQQTTSKPVHSHGAKP